MLTRIMPSPEPATAEQRILAAIRAVPQGQVASYGGIARRAGLPGRARLVARILGGSDETGLPWHRILRSDGRIAFPAGSPQWQEQVCRLQAEGVQLRASKGVEGPWEAAVNGPIQFNSVRKDASIALRQSGMSEDDIRALLGHAYDRIEAGAVR